MTLLGVLYIVVGTTLWGIDVYSGMPALWTMGEGPCTIVIGAVVLWLQHAGRSHPDVV